LAIKGLGEHTTKASGLLSTAIVGGAFIPILQGMLADNPAVTLRYAFFLPVICYLFIAWYGSKGYKTDK
jgi:FHS family L-fucose permease-like MFS transporter